MSEQRVKWLRSLAAKGAKGVVNNIDARAVGRIADDLERLLADRAVVYYWIRESDNVENASLEWVIEWLNRRPTRECSPLASHHDHVDASEEARQSNLLPVPKGRTGT